MSQGRRRALYCQLQVLDTRQPWTPGAAAPAQGHRGAPPGPRAPMAQPQHQTMTLPHHLHSHAGAMGGGVATGAADCGPSAKRARVAVEDVLQQHAAKDLVSELMGWGRSNSQMPPQGSQQQQQQQHAPHGEPVAAAAAATLSLPGTTDFRGLYARHTQQPGQGRPPPSAQPTQQTATAPPAAPGTQAAGPQASGGGQVAAGAFASATTAGLRTFADVATRPAAAVEVGRQELLGTMRSLYSANTNLGRCGSQLDLLTGGLGPSAAAGLGTAAGAGVGHAGAAAAAAAAHAGVVEELTPEELPVDWSLKRSVVVASGSRFACHDLAQAAAPRTRWHSMQSAIMCNLEACRGEAEQYLASLISWRHPEAPLDRATLTALTTAAAAASAPPAAGPGKQQPGPQGSSVGGGGGGGGGSTWSAVGAGGGSAHGSVTGGCAGVLAGRLAAWRHALHSLYGTYRGGSCHVFYVINTPARHPFVALFGHCGVRGCGGEPFALLSQSTRALRNKLVAAGVPFSMPLEGDGEAAAGTAAGPGARQGREGGRQGKAGAQGQKGQGEEAAGEEGDGDLCDEAVPPGTNGGATPAPGSTVPDNSRQSLLLLRGPRAVHGLYDFLYCETNYPTVGGTIKGAGAAAAAAAAASGSEEWLDLPLLLAPAPFEGGSVWRPAIKAITMSTHGHAAAEPSSFAAPLPPAAAAAGPQQPQHVLQLTGPLPPWTVRRLAVLLAKVHPAAFTASFESEPCSIPLNAPVVEGAMDCGGDGRGGQQGRGEQGDSEPTFASGGALTLDELRAWRRAGGQLGGGRPVRGLACDGSRRLAVRL